MSIKKLIFPILSLLLILSSCTNTDQKPATDSSTTAPPKIDEAYKSVMAVHDEVMPEMGTIHRLRKQMGEKMSNENSTPEDKDLATKMVDRLDAADEGMMSWMAEFKMPKEGTEEAKLEYLKDQQLKVDKVSKDMFSAIADAKKLLE